MLLKYFSEQRLQANVSVFFFVMRAFSTCCCCNWRCFSACIASGSNLFKKRLHHCCNESDVKKSKLSSFKLSCHVAAAPLKQYLLRYSSVNSKVWYRKRSFAMISWICCMNSLTFRYMRSFFSYTTGSSDVLLLTNKFDTKQSTSCTCRFFSVIFSAKNAKNNDF